MYDEILGKKNILLSKMNVLKLYVEKNKKIKL